MANQHSSPAEEAAYEAWCKREGLDPGHTRTAVKWHHCEERRGVLSGAFATPTAQKAEGGETFDAITANSSVDALEAIAGNADTRYGAAISQNVRVLRAHIADADDTIKQLTRALREATEPPTFMGEPVSRPTPAAAAEPHWGITPETLNRHVSPGVSLGHELNRLREYDRAAVAAGVPPEVKALLRMWQSNLGSSRASCDRAGKLLWDRIEAVLAASGAPAGAAAAPQQLPDGYVLVPREPTPKMMTAVDDAYGDGGDFLDMWAAALAAVPANRGIAMTTLERIRELASEAVKHRGGHSFKAVPAMHAFNEAIEPDFILKLLDAVKAAKYVAYSNGFDAALPEKKEALVAALQELEETQ